jgi:hypothetical protein
MFQRPPLIAKKHIRKTLTYNGDTSQNRDDLNSKALPPSMGIEVSNFIVKKPLTSLKLDFFFVFLFFWGHLVGMVVIHKRNEKSTMLSLHPFKRNFTTYEIRFNLFSIFSLFSRSTHSPKVKSNMCRQPSEPSKFY